MYRRYTLTECYALFQVDPKTFRRWLEKAEIVPQASRADDRVKYLTHEQVQKLAALHDKQLPDTLPHQEATLPTGTYKLMLDQLEELHQTQAQLHEQMQAMWQTSTELSEQVHLYRSEQETQRVSFDTLRVLTEHHLKEMQQINEAQHKQLEALTELLNDHRRLLREHKEELTAQIAQHQQETDQKIEGNMQGVQGKIEYLEAAVAGITSFLEEERAARQALEQEVTTLKQQKTPAKRSSRAKKTTS